ncbi:MAG: ATP-binding protein [Moraxella sp.]|nr:ATP-binding protein [Moraxella sp.]
MRNLGFHSLFSRLFVSVFLALIVFAIAMVSLSQLVHNNSQGVRSRAIAEQVAVQIEPFLEDISNPTQEGNRLQLRFTLAVIKKSFDIFDENLNAKIGLYDTNKHLILQTQDSNLPEKLPFEPSWYTDILPSPSGNVPHHVLIKMRTGHTLWYESRIPPKFSPWLRWFNLFTGTVLLLAIMSVALWWFARSMTERINQMAQKIKLMGDGDFSVRVNEVGNDEISSLAYGFNQSAQKIEQLINANSLLLAHASHEFRTPITRIRLQIEMMDMLAQKLDAESHAKFDKRASAINRDLTGLNDLVESILLVSRLDAGHALQQMEKVDLYELIAQECHHYHEATLYGESVQMQAQPKLLTHLIRNLLNNALIHGVPPITIYVYGVQNSDDTAIIPAELLENNTPVISTADDEAQTQTDTSNDSQNSSTEKTKLLGRLNLKRSNKSKTDKTPAPPNYAVLAVIDQGDGIPVDKREDIFSPFVRLKQEKKGSGLGLSLVSQIVGTHGGHISTDTWQGKTRFLVVLPVQQKQHAPPIANNIDR